MSKVELKIPRHPLILPEVNGVLAMFLESSHTEPQEVCLDVQGCYPPVNLTYRFNFKMLGLAKRKNPA